MKLYTKTICPKCLWVKAELKQKNIDVTEINIEHDDEACAFLQSEGVLAVPALQVGDTLYTTTADIFAQIGVMTA